MGITSHTRLTGAGDVPPTRLSHPGRKRTRRIEMTSHLSDLRFLTVGEVADMMRVSSMTVYRMVHAGDIPAVRFG
eukprot:gene18342-22453_t